MIWYHLPLEVRFMVLSALTEDANCNLSSAAVVSREWQAALEPHIFAYIRVMPPRIAQLNSMTQRNRGLVRYIWFCIELEPYDCETCHLYNGLFHGDSNNDLILKSFRSLFTALSTWDLNGSLTLDVSLYSRSDRRHAFKYLTFMPDAPGHNVEPTLTAQNEEYNKHRWEASGLGPRLPPRMSLESLFAYVTLTYERDLKYLRKMPKVTAVTRLVMRLQTHRTWNPRTIVPIISCLPKLREFHYEPWRLWYDEMQELWDEGYLDLLAATKGLDKFTIFENFNQQFPLCFPESDVLPIRVPSVSLSLKLARVNLSAEALSASFMADAEHFFSASSSTWPNLTSLTLTSQLLAPQTCPTELMDLFKAAASAARSMPKLKTLEIWNGLEGLAALFKYEFIPSYQRRSAVTWRATWRVSIQTEVVEAWEKVTRNWGDYPDGIDMVYESVNPEEIKSHADAVMNLKLSEMVIRPISLQQIQREQSFIRSLVA
ncbi:hypothetical protein B0I35DRAFT_456794 [Stachybotrys elegans]|uniref:DUF6546 domain-containing protein n=1 Tax=Stachybotrys elegans TaxID=80388 RepID=A0A8K0WX76_9HYPO|nr:hypothetical protein B0I35DRAFT_456794 [Stachybotrys elegans]